MGGVIDEINNSQPFFFVFLEFVQVVGIHYLNIGFNRIRIASGLTNLNGLTGIVSFSPRAMPPQGCMRSLLKWVSSAMKI